MREMGALKLEMHEMHKTADFHSNLLVSEEMVTGAYNGRPIKYTHLMHFNEVCAFWREMHDGKTLTRYGNSLVSSFMVGTVGQTWDPFLELLAVLFWILATLGLHATTGPSPIYALAPICLTSVTGQELVNPCH